MDRIVNLELWNYSNVEYSFGGEYFENGGWALETDRKKILRKKGCWGDGSPKKRKDGTPTVDPTAPKDGEGIERRSSQTQEGKDSKEFSPKSRVSKDRSGGAGTLTLTFHNTAYFAGTAGYVYYFGSDGSCIELAFVSPFSGSNRFTARRYNNFGGNAMQLYQAAAEVGPPGTKIRTSRADLMWQTQKATGDVLTMRVIIPDPVLLKQVGEGTMATGLTPKKVPKDKENQPSPKGSSGSKSESGSVSGTVASPENLSLDKGVDKEGRVSSGLTGLVEKGASVGDKDLSLEIGVIEMIKKAPVCNSFKSDINSSSGMGSERTFFIEVSLRV